MSRVQISTNSKGEINISVQKHFKPGLGIEFNPNDVNDVIVFNWMCEKARRGITGDRLEIMTRAQWDFSKRSYNSFRRHVEAEVPIFIEL